MNRRKNTKLKIVKKKKKKIKHGIHTTGTILNAWINSKSSYETNAQAYDPFIQILNQNQRNLSYETEITSLYRFECIFKYSDSFTGKEYVQTDQSSWGSRLNANKLLYLYPPGTRISIHTIEKIQMNMNLP